MLLTGHVWRRRRGMGPPGPCSGQSCSQYFMSRTSRPRDMISQLSLDIGDNRPSYLQVGHFLCWGTRSYCSWSSFLSKGPSFSLWGESFLCWTKIIAGEIDSLILIERSSQFLVGRICSCGQNFQCVAEEFVRRGRVCNVRGRIFPWMHCPYETKVK